MILTGVSIKSEFGDFELPATLVCDFGDPINGVIAHGFTINASR
jgi:hypothetical protein